MDKYKNFQDLSSHEKGNYRIAAEDRNTPIAVLAIHGGLIEPGTTEVSTALAGSDRSLYLFEGIKSSDNRDLHITSVNFDEPVCLNLVNKSEKAVSIHGKKGEEKFVMVGGLDFETGERVENSLNNLGFETRIPGKDVDGRSSSNICNKCLSGKGLQIEISKGLRDDLVANPELMEKFTEAILHPLEL